MTSASTFADAYAAKSCAGPVVNSDLVRHVIGAVRTCSMDGEPFPHAEVRPFLSDKVHASALAQWPADSVFDAIELKGQSAYVGSRRARLVCDWPNKPGVSALGGVWSEIGDVLGSPEVVRALFERFSSALDGQLGAFGSATQDTPGFRMYLCRDCGSSDALGAHVDAPRKLLTIVVYLDLEGAVNDDSPSRWGTRLYGDKGEMNKPLEFTENHLHPIVKTIKFARNSAFVMPNTRASLHGVSGGQPDVIRKTIMCGYWLFNR